MTGQQLRNSILQEAIHGRLVPNVLDPEEKTGAELLQQILKERQDKENKEKGKKAKKLTLSTIEEEPWELPEGWCWCKLPEMCEIQFGTRVVKKNDEGSTYYVYGGGGATFKVDSYNRENALLVSRFAMSRQCVRFVTGKFFLNDSGLSLQTYGSSVRQSYLNYLVFAFNDTIYHLGRGAAQKNLNMDEFVELLLPLPPLSIQKAIVAKLEELLPLVDEYDKAAGELETLNKILPDKLRKSVLQEAIHGTLVPNDIPEGEATGAELLQQIIKERQEKENKEKGKKAKKLTLSTIEEEPWELPEGWCWARLGDVMTFVNGRAYKKEELLSSGKYKVLRVGNFFTNDSWYYSDLELPDEKYCFKGDLLYAWSASFGPWIWEGDKTIFHYHIWNVKFNEDKLCKKYLYWFFEADKHIIKESTTGSTMIHVSMENMMPRLIPIPPLSIQHRIVEKIEEVFSAINTL